MDHALGGLIQNEFIVGVPLATLFHIAWGMYNLPFEF